MTDLAEAEMDIYSIDKLMHETRQLAAKYHQTTGTALPVTGEIARFDAAKALGLPTRRRFLSWLRCSRYRKI